MASVANIELELTNKLAEAQGIFNNSRSLLVSNPYLGKSGIEAAFLQGECAWEVFLENIVVALLCGEPTLSGNPDAGYLAPASEDVVRKMVLVGAPYCEWANPDKALDRVTLFFPLQHRIVRTIAASKKVLDDAHTVRNAIAHSSGPAQEKFARLWTSLLGSKKMVGRPADFLTAGNAYGHIPALTMFESYIQHWQSLCGILVA